LLDLVLNLFVVIAIIVIVFVLVSSTISTTETAFILSEKEVITDIISWETIGLITTVPISCRLIRREVAEAAINIIKNNICFSILISFRNKNI
jgi:hypothetical protein